VVNTMMTMRMVMVTAMVMDTTPTMAMTTMTVMKTMQKMTTVMARDKDERATQVSNLTSVEETKQIKKGLE
jgi:hypothetical protein